MVYNKGDNLGTHNSNIVKSHEENELIHRQIIMMLQCVGRTLRSSGSLCLRVCREEHILGVINLLNSLDKMWVSHYHCFIVWWHVSGFCCMVLLLGFVVKQTCVLEWSLTYSGLPYFFFFIMTTISWGINYLTTYFISLLCPYQYHKLEFNTNV